MKQRPPILHPLSILAMMLLGLNDHIWKEAYGNMWTGKLSDVAGLIFFPLLLEYIIPSRRISVLCTGIVFTLINLSELCNLLWRKVFQWIYDILGTQSIAHSTLDWTDVLTLPALMIPLFIIPQKEKKNEASKTM